MGRGVWFVAGAGAGVYATMRARRLAEAATVDGLRDRAQGLAAAARVFADEVRAGSAERETELRSRLRLVPDEETSPPGASPDPTHDVLITETRPTSGRLLGTEGTS